MLLEILIGLVIGTFAAITISACIEIAKDIFDRDSDVNQVDVIKVDSELFKDIASRHPKLRAAMNNETTGVVFQYVDGKLIDYATLEKSLSSDFDDCNGYRFTSDKVDTPIKI